MWKLYNQDNLSFYTERKANLIYADMIYENLDFNWINHYWKQLKHGSVFIIQTDYHSVAEIKVYTNGLPDAYFVNWLIWKNEFGNFKKDRFRQAHDDILIFSKGKDFKFNGEKVQVEKVTAKSKGLNPSGRITKLATSLITDICLTTVSSERIKLNGKCVKWQKPLALLRRLFSPFVVSGDLILDPFVGTGTSGMVALELGCDFIGIENNPEIFSLAMKRMENIK